MAQPLSVTLVLAAALPEHALDEPEDLEPGPMGTLPSKQAV